ncbi:MAG: alkaline phosphatase family protein, partial [Candidatus Binatia bacterium]
MARVVAFLVDGLSPSFLDPGLAAGSLVHLRGLFERGRSLRLGGPDPHLPGTAPETFVTGVPLADHKRLHSRQLLPGTYVVEETHPETELAHEPFWRFVSDAGLRTTVASVEAAPLLNHFRGTQVIGWGDSATGGLHPRFDPPEVRSWLEEVAPGRRSGPLHRVPETHDDFRAYVDSCRRAMSEQARAARMLLERTDWDLFLMAFDALHEAGHLLWGFHERGGSD